MKKSYASIMKNKLWLVLAVFTAAVFLGCNRDSAGSSSSREGENFDSDSSYALGMSIGMDVRSILASGGIVPNLDEFIKGMRDVLSGESTRLNEGEADMKIQEAFLAIMGDIQDNSRQEGIDFLVENSRKPGVRITPSGLQYEILTETNGPKPSIDDRVQVHYEGRLTDGTLFSSSYDYGEPVDFVLNQVIPGWSEGLQLMSAGSKYRFFIPSEIGYGPVGEGPIPPFSTLIFIVELLEIL